MKTVLLVGRHQSIEPLGIEALAGVAKKAGWERDVILVKDGDFEPAIRRAQETQPDLVAFSIWTGFHLQSFAAADKIRAMGLKVAAGGPHATFWPESCIPHFHYVCKGEGFRTFRQILDGEIGPGVHFDDERLAEGFPIPDRAAVYDRYPDLRDSPIKSVMHSIGCPFTCVTGDSLIWLDDGPATIESVVSRLSLRNRIKCVHGDDLSHQVGEYEFGESVISSQGRQIASSILDQGCKPTYELKADNGMSIRGTYEHRLASIENGRQVWKQMGDLKPGDWIVMQSPVDEWPAHNVQLPKPKLRELRGRSHNKIDVTPFEMDDRLAWVTGFLIGDGCLPSDGRAVVHFCLKPGSREKLINLIPQLFGKDLGITDQINTTKIQNGWLYSRVAYDFFVEVLGIHPGPEKLKIPESIWRSPKSVARAFLDGLWAADGTKKNGSSIEGGDYLTTCSKRLANDVALLMLKLRLPPGIFSDEARGFGHNPFHRVFLRKSDRIPTGKAIYKSAKSGKYLWRTPRDPSVTGVKRVTLNESGLNHRLNLPDRFYFQVESVEPTGQDERVYDLSVASAETFVCGGFLTHNCSYCYAPAQNRLYGGFSLALRPVDEIIEEAVEIRDKWGVSLFYAQDDIHGFRIQWLEEMSSKWAQFVKVPWHCQIRLELTQGDIGDQRLDLFKAGGCTGVTLAIESGNEFLRRYVLIRSMPDELILEGIAKIQKRGLTIRTEQILAVPFSDVATDLETLELNCRLNPDMAWTSILSPFVGTDIGTITKNFGFYSGNNDDLSETFFDRSVLKHVKHGWRSVNRLVEGSTINAKDNPLLRMKLINQHPDRTRAAYGIDGGGHCTIEYLSPEENDRYCGQTVILQRLFNWLAKVPSGHLLGRKIVDLPEGSRSWEAVGKVTNDHMVQTVGLDECERIWYAFSDEWASLTQDSIPDPVKANIFYFAYLPSGPEFAKSLFDSGILDKEDPTAEVGTKMRHWLFDRALYKIKPALPPIAHSGLSAAKSAEMSQSTNPEKGTFPASLPIVNREVSKVE